MKLDDVQFVLLRPRWALNLGAVARAMKNFGLRRLTLVDSRIGSWADAWRMAVHADDILRAATTAPSLADALSAATWVVGTSSRPLAGQRVLSPRELAAEAVQRGAPTLLFGGEIHGLTPAELLRCHDVACIPVAPEQPSLNLAQAAAVFAAELFAAHANGTAAAPPAAAAAGPQPADGALMQRLETALQHLLETSAWADADRGKHEVAELVQPLYRARLTDHEVRRWLVALNKVVRPRGDGRPTTGDAAARDPAARDPATG